MSALIFQKAMRKKDVKGASKTGEKENIDVLNLARDTATNKPEVDEDEADLKGKQSTVNLISIDTNRIFDFASVNYTFPGILFKLIVSFAFLISIISWKALLTGFLAMSLNIPLNIYFSKRYSAAQERLMKVKDVKMRVVIEALQGKNLI